MRRCERASLDLDCCLREARRRSVSGALRLTATPARSSLGDVNARGIVVRVIDGDTVWVRLRVRLRRSAPDTGPEAVAAADRLDRQFPPGTRVELLLNAIDDYGRIVGDLVEDRSVETRTRRNRV
jgi:endonuclease YncB( thermonuclease family)